MSLFCFINVLQNVTNGYFVPGSAIYDAETERGDIVIIIEQRISEVDDYSLCLTRYGLREVRCAPMFGHRHTK